jgi:hypothetical protein
MARKESQKDLLPEHFLTPHAENGSFFGLQSIFLYRRRRQHLSQSKRQRSATLKANLHRNRL